MPRKVAPPPAWRNRVKELRYCLPSELADHPLQWRVHGETQKAVVQGILQEVGIAGALLAYESPATGRLTSIDGHLRKGLAAMPWPTLILDLTDDEAALVLASYDPVGALAAADRGQLTLLLASVQSGAAAVQAFLAQLAEEQGLLPEPAEPEPVQEPEEPWDRLGEVMARWQVQEGDLWALGEHRILCADCLVPATLERLLGEDTPAMIFADPPYGVSIVATNGYVGSGEAYNIPWGRVKTPRRRGYVGGGQRTKDRTGHDPIETWDKDARGTGGAAKPFGSKPQQGQIGGLGYKGAGVPFRGKQARGSDGAPHVVAVGKYAPVIGDESTDTAIRAATTFLNAYPDAVHVWWGGNYYADALPASSCWLVWNKETTGHFADCELAWTNQPKAARLFTHRWNGMLRDSERERRWHPTQKPAALAAWVFETLGEVDDLILDPFLGSAPSLLAAAQCGRRVYGCELSVEYVAIALDRWHTLTGRTPVRLA